jgi:hypothetical protein
MWPYKTAPLLTHDVPFCDVYDLCEMADTLLHCVKDLSEMADILLRDVHDPKWLTSCYAMLMISAHFAALP